VRVWGPLQRYKRPFRAAEICRCCFSVLRQSNRSEDHSQLLICGRLSDLSFRVPDGSLIKGRSQIENFYSGVFAGGYGASTAIATIDQLRFLSADLALVDGQFTVRRVLSANDQQLPPERGFFTIIAQRVSGRWLIVANREMEPLLG